MMISLKPGMVNAWRQAFQKPMFLLESILTVLALTVALFLCREVIHYAHTRPAVQLNDPVLRVFGPVSVRWPIFLVLWSSLIVSLRSLARSPRRFLTWLQAATILAVFRAVALFLVPLEPLPTIIPLADPVATIRTEGGAVITEDLFFSGHTATLFLLFLAVKPARLKLFLFAATVFAGFGVLLQHVHYSGDVFAAPFFAYGSWRLALFMRDLFNAGRHNTPPDETTDTPTQATLEEAP